MTACLTKQLIMHRQNRLNYFTCISKKAVAQSTYAQTATHLIAISVLSGAALICGQAKAQSSAAPAAQKATALTADQAEPSLAYTVLPQDKLIVLSRTLLNGAQAWASVAQYNGLKNPNLIYPGQTLQIPLRYLAAKPSGGTVISTSGSVTVGGQPLVSGTAIRAGQQFKTGADGSAMLELGDGSRIKLLPNTLAEVVTNSDYALRDASSSGSTNWFSGLMRLTEGALEAFASKTTKRATPLQIQTPTSVVGVRGTQFRVAFDDPITKAARTEVLEGKVRADNPSQGAGADLPMGTGAVVKPLEKDIKVVNLLPAPDTAGIASEIFQPQASLSLPNLAGAANYRVLIASDEKFDKVVRSLKVAANSPADLSGLPNGNWYALVRGIDGIGLEGFNTIKLISIKDALPAPTTDSWRQGGNRLVSLSTDAGQTSINWTASPGDPVAKSYLALIGRDAARLQPSAGGESTTRSLNLGVLAPGTYNIRLRTTLASGQVSDSALYRFDLNSNWGQTVFSLLSALEAVK